MSAPRFLNTAAICGTIASSSVLSIITRCDQSINEGRSPLSHGKIPKSSCEKYNTLWNRLQWAERRKRCSSESGCVLLGRNMTGTCTPVDISAPAAAKQSEKEVLDKENSLVKLYVEVASEKSAEPIKILLKESITNSAVDSLRESKYLASEISKTLVINFFDDPDNLASVSSMISRAITSDSSLQTVASSLASNVRTSETLYSSLIFMKQTRDYYIDLNGIGFLDTKALTVYLLDWWIRDPKTRLTVIIPLLEWSVSLDKEIRAPASSLAASALPLSQSVMTEAIKQIAISTLESDETRVLVRDSILSFLKQSK